MTAEHDDRITEVPARWSGLDRVEQLRYETLYEPFGLPRDLVHHAEQPDARHFLATDEEGVAGYVRLSLDGPEARVNQLCVAERRRGNGLGRALVETLVERAREAGATRVVLDARVEAIGFYKRLGFDATSGVYVKEPSGLRHVKMARDI